MSVAQPFGWSCSEVMQFPRSLSPGISGVKTSRLFRGDRPVSGKKRRHFQELPLNYSSKRVSFSCDDCDVLLHLLCEDGSYWSHSPGEESLLIWRLMFLHLHKDIRIQTSFSSNVKCLFEDIGYKRDTFVFIFGIETVFC